MTVKSLTRSSVLTRTDYRSMLAGNEAYSAGAMELISTTIASGSSSAISFTSIPQIYKHLQVRWTARSSYAANTSLPLNWTINGSTGIAYAHHRLYGHANGTVYSGSTTGGYSMLLGRIPTAGKTTGAFTAGVLDVLDYTNTSKNTTYRLLSGSDVTTEQELIALYSGLYLSLSAVTQISITDNAGANFAAGSRFSLYGIKG